jgi:tetratricopeptide (TPR) repeat protein
VQKRLREYAARADVSLGTAGDLEDHVRDAIRVAAADAMVEELVRLISQTPGDLEVLWQVSVFPFPVPIDALAVPRGSPGSSLDISQLAAVVDRLVASSLLAIFEDGRVVVHRWTAESLKSYIAGEAYQGYCVRAARYLEERPVTNRQQWMADLTEAMRLFLAAREFDSAAASAKQLINFLRPYGQTTVWTELAREAGVALPNRHRDKGGFISIEGDGLVSMGFATQALERYRLALGIAERLVEQEPGRADYLRELSVSYSKMGDLQSALGQGETARQFYEKDLGIAERLVEQEPGRADY